MTPQARQRREAILAHVQERGHATVRALAEECGVSAATIRRDLRALAEEGLLEVTHGGARIRRSTDYSFYSKNLRNPEAKETIARLAAGCVADGDQVFLGSGTTSYRLGARLKGRRDVSVIVNSVRVAGELDAPGVSVLMLGGQYRCGRMDMVGPLALTAMEQFRGYIAFVGTDGLGRDFGVTASDVESAHLYRQAVKNARESIVIADSSKFAAPSLYRIVEWDAISRVVTDQEPDAQWREIFQRHDIEVICPETVSGEGASGRQEEAGVST
ncbi:MAG: DeoR/GlpR transcriptional regulator [Phycisphaerae bacterium]|nr:DeoR/GlpR transcriptional regulator [Phycisphaerae bacterium]